jgi:hypothetical protein
MPFIHHVITVFVHGFGCAHSDWAAQVGHFAPPPPNGAIDLAPRKPRPTGRVLLPAVRRVRTTYSDGWRERWSMSVGQSTRYLDMLRANIPANRIEIIPDTGCFPQIDEPAQTNAPIDSFIARLPAR